MGAFSRAELEEAFAHYKAVSAEAARTGNWAPWADLFTDDVTYIEHHFGEMHGRQVILDWITETMRTPPNDSMSEFPIEWHVADDERGWVVFCAQNRMQDPGDGSVHQAPSWSLIKYAGNGLWSYEEDLYNPNEFVEMIGAWAQAKGRAGT